MQGISISKVQHVNNPVRKGVMVVFPGNEGTVLLDETVIDLAYALLKGDTPFFGTQEWRFEGWIKR